VYLPHQAFTCVGTYTVQEYVGPYPTRKRGVVSVAIEQEKVGHGVYTSPISYSNLLILIYSSSKQVYFLYASGE
jgi:hypothetical protein